MEVRRSALAVLFLTFSSAVLFGCGSDAPPPKSDPTDHDGWLDASTSELDAAQGTDARDAAEDAGGQHRVEATVDVEGAEVHSADGLLTLSIPKAALTQEVSITIDLVDQPPPGAHGPVYELGPEGLTFEVPVALTFALPQQTVREQLAGMRVATYADGQWIPLDTEWIEYQTPSLGGFTTHFSAYGVVDAAKAEDPCPCDQEATKKCCFGEAKLSSPCTCTLSQTISWTGVPENYEGYWQRNRSFVWGNQSCYAANSAWKPDLTQCTSHWRECCKNAGGIGPMGDGTVTFDLLVNDPRAGGCVCDLGPGARPADPLGIYGAEGFRSCITRKLEEKKVVVNHDPSCPEPMRDAGIPNTDTDAGQADGGYPLSEFCERTLERPWGWVEKVDDCCNGKVSLTSFIAALGLENGIEGCLHSLQPLLDQGTVLYYGKFAEACASAFDARYPLPPPACPEQSIEQLRASALRLSRRLSEFPVCHQAFVGTIHEGEPCSNSLECTNGLRCRSTPGGSRTCQPEPTGAGPCRDSDDCPYGYVCKAGPDGLTCVGYASILKQLDAPCSRDLDCSSGFVCDETCRWPDAGTSCQ